MSGFVAVAVADNDQVNVNDIRRLGAFVASAFGRNQPGIATTGSPEERGILRSSWRRVHLACREVVRRGRL